MKIAFWEIILMNFPTPLAQHSKTLIVKNVSIISLFICNGDQKEKCETNYTAHFFVWKNLCLPSQP
jgi:hypothetical protein